MLRFGKGNESDLAVATATPILLAMSRDGS